MTHNLFLTGASGCVGHYIFDELVKDPNNQLYLLLRNPNKLKRDLKLFPNVQIIQGEMKELARQTDLLKTMDAVVHVAAGWGDGETNYDYTRELFQLLDPRRCQKVIYFSTASILDEKNQLNTEVERIGTCYITSKYQLSKELPQLPIYPRVITLFPTWVLGGDDRHPYSHALEGIVSASQQLWWLRFLSFDLKFHFIHAQDIALITDYLLKNDTAANRYVLGNAATSVDQVIAEICAYFKVKRPFKINIKRGLLNMIVNLLGNRVSEWDKYCLNRREFVHQVSDAATFGLVSQHRTIAQILSGL
ncbi:NAD(P)-dependent oxidoreductase [Candidatus Saganbacteria bacterium]|nr:NAD(P)-dependent oxidoreductase [Candidatus Saganbacteria bacterium]